MDLNYKLRCCVIGHEQDVRAVTALPYPDGSFVSGSRDVTSRVWVPDELSMITWRGYDVRWAETDKYREGQDFHEGLIFGGHNGFVSAVCVIPPDDEFPHGLIVTGSNDHVIHAYTLDSPEPKYRLTGHTGNVCTLAAGKFGSLISGSWDMSARVWLKQKCLMTLQGHEAAVWGVAVMPEGGYMITASADKTIKLWKAGKCERTYTGHGDCVRGVAVLNPHQFLSCSNDTTIRHWSTVDGTCLKIYYGHISFVYAVVALPNGTDFISCGEDRMLRIWRGGTLSQSIAHPAQSVWSTCVLTNGDIVTGASDGVIRLFTTSAERVTSASKLAEYEQLIAASEIPAQIGDIKTDDLVGPSALQVPGQRDGQTMMVRQVNCIEAYQWSASESRWIKVGNVVGGLSDSQSTSSRGKTHFEGKEYDFVFNVEIYEDKPPLKLPYNIDEDPWVAAHNFLDHNNISQMFLDQVANFILQQTAGITLGASTASVMSDPFTGGARYVPGSAGESAASSKADPFTGSTRYIATGESSSTAGPSFQTKTSANSYFPEINYIRFDQCNPQQLFAKLHEFNLQCDVSCQFSDADISSLENLVSGQQGSTPAQLDTLWRMMQWPAGVLFPVLDILRLSVRDATANEHFCGLQSNGPRLVDFACAVFTNSLAAQPKNHLLMLRTLCNAFQHAVGEQLMLDSGERLLAAAKVALQSGADKPLQIALSSFILNLTIGYRHASNVAGKERCLLLAADLTQLLGDLESQFRLLVAIGTAVTDDWKLAELAKSLELPHFLRNCQSSTMDKVQNCAQQLLVLLDS